MNAIFWFWITGQQMNDSNVFINLRPEHGERGFSHCRTNVFDMTLGLHAQFKSLEDTGENATLKIAPKIVTLLS